MLKGDRDEQDRDREERDELCLNLTWFSYWGNRSDNRYIIIVIVINNIGYTLYLGLALPKTP